MNNILIWVIVAIVVIGGGWWILSSNQMGTATTTPNTVTVDQGTNSTGDMTGVNGTQASTSVDVSAGTPAMTATVTYSGTSFTPATVTIKKGGSVTFVDSGTRGIWVGSAPHPAHTGYDGTDRATHCAAGYTGPAPFDQCKLGASYTFKFDKAGTWPYHDHDNASAFGKVVVVE